MLLTAQTLVELSEWNDRIGVLSIYRGRSVAAANDKPTAPIEIKEQARELMSRAREDCPGIIGRRCRGGSTSSALASTSSSIPRGRDGVASCLQGHHG